MSIETLSEAMLRIGERFGVPVLLLAVILWFGREAVIGVHGSVVEPVIESHTKFIDTICEQAKQQTNAMERQADAFRELSQAHEEQLVILREAFPAKRVEAEPRRAPVVPQ
jgi:hypothetical protein